VRVLASLALTVCLAYIAVNSYVYVASYAAGGDLTIGQVIVFSAISIALDLWPAILASVGVIAAWVVFQRSWRRRSNKRIERAPQG